MRQHHPGRIVALNGSVRVHSGLTAGGNGRVMGTARGPLLDLLLTAGALGVVGSAGSSFSEVASLLALGPPPLANLRVRTPFIKSHQGKVRYHCENRLLTIRRAGFRMARSHSLRSRHPKPAIVCLT